MPTALSTGVLNVNALSISQTQPGGAAAPPDTLSGSGRILPTVRWDQWQQLASKPWQGVERKWVNCILGHRPFREQRHLKNANCS